MRFSELDGRRVAVWGLGRETLAFAAELAARLPRARLTHVVSEDGSGSLDHPGLSDAALVDVRQAAQELGAGDVLVRSPGVSIHKPAMQLLTVNGVAITTATSLWLHEREGARVIGVTGTKGKSTTATILAHLSAQLRPTELAGNIGRPVITLLDLPADHWVVLELSSYQIADLACGPELAVVTNLYREHVDWHITAATYRAEKLRLLSLPQVRACVYRPGDPEVDAAAAQVPARFPFGTADGWHPVPGGIAHGPEAMIPTAGFTLRGPRNVENLCAALAALDAAGLARPPLPDALTDVPALPHRLQTVLTDAAGVEWVNDSISTTPESTLAALEAFPDRPIVLIAGGVDRQQDHAELARELARRSVTLITLPVTGERLAADARAAGLDTQRILNALEMTEAVGVARAHAEPGGVVLLSPAAPSFIHYRDFEQRGEHFAALARER